MKNLILLLPLFSFLAACSLMELYPSDNGIEEVVEQVIEQKTGLDLDLSPFSPETRLGEKSQP